MQRQRRASVHQPIIPGFLPALEGSLVAGVDEVGRGALFGPVVAAAVILPESASQELAAAGVTDSKLLSAMQRQVLAQSIRRLATDCQIGYASVQEIDRLNILQASLLAMRRAISRLKVQPSLCLIDGNQRVSGLPLPQQTIVKGDRESLVIASASIIAKVWRDELITRLSLRYPHYGLAANKGYGTPTHRRAIAEYGPTRYHRRSFRPCCVSIEPTD
ncbi:MAG: ribonuclease HII [Oscillatoriales cyanobacterium C42_A2020_001]|nr:ribonuclease HII [Leptolyngbyaceae cyanobacterium C42_A2020_001]